MLRIATWNIQRPKLNGWKRRPNIEAKLREMDADIWVLTETNASIVPPPPLTGIAGYVPLASLPANFHTPGESCSTVWSRLGIKSTIRTFEPDTSVCAEIDTTFGAMLVYGTIITYPGDRGKGNARPWEEHKQAISDHATDWARIRAAFPDHLFCIAGDFNQNRDNTKWFPSPIANQEAVSQMTSVLDSLSMSCVTEHDIRADHDLTRANIDHICMPKVILPGMTIRAHYWEDRKLSDHNGVCVEISL